MTKFNHFWTISVLQSAPSMQIDTITIFGELQTAIEAGKRAFAQFGRRTSVFPGKHAYGISGKRVWESEWQTA